MAENRKEQKAKHDPPACDGVDVLPRFEVDFEKYLEYSQKFDMTEEQQRELIAALTIMMMTHVDIQFGIDATSAACGEVDQIVRSNETASGDVVELGQSEITGAFNTKRGAA